ncbi:MAG: transcription antitermination factor NusB [Micrococcaceae bacterium]
MTGETTPSDAAQTARHRTSVSARGRARRRALEILFEAEQRDSDPLKGIQQRRDSTDQTINPYTVELVHGVVAEREQIDEILSTYAQGWTLERMPSVDRSILRVGAWELLFNDEIPDGVAVAEAVSMARDYSTDSSPEYINGLLGRLQQIKPTLLA